MGTHSSHTLGTVALWLSILGVIPSFILIGLPLLETHPSHSLETIAL